MMMSPNISVGDDSDDARQPAFRWPSPGLPLAFRARRDHRLVRHRDGCMGRELCGDAGAVAPLHTQPATAFRTAQPSLTVSGGDLRVDARTIMVAGRGPDTIAITLGGKRLRRQQTMS
jgi:hypothetical protein